MSETVDAVAPGTSTDAELLPAFRAALERSEDAVVVLHCAGEGTPMRVRWANRTFETQTGYDAGEIVGERFSMLYGSDTDILAAQQWTADVLRGRAIKGELLLYRKNGTSFWAELTWRRVEGDSGLILCTQRDAVRLKSDAKLQQLRNILSAVVANTSAAIYAKNLAERFLLVNKEFADLVGVPETLLVGRRVDGALSPELATALRRSADQALASEAPVVDEERLTGADGRVRAMLSVTFPLRDDTGAIFGICGMSTDVTDRARARERLELFSYAMDSANDGIAIYEIDGDQWRISYVNQMFERLSGYHLDEVRGRSSDMLFAGTHEQLQSDRAALLRGEAVRGRYHMKRKDDGTFWADATSRALIGEDGFPSHSVVVFRDVTADIVRERRLSHEASHDALTGIYNRRHFLYSLEAALAEVRAGHRRHVLVYFDLDGFKPINDTHGHAAGDKVLIELTSAVGARIRSEDIFARMGGDEFAILFRDCDDPQSVAHDVLDAARTARAMWNEHRLGVRASVGATRLAPMTPDAHAALRLADAACYEAKHTGKDRVVVV